MVILTRPGNPRRIEDFHDVAQPGIRMVHPDPRTSGSGEWGVLAAYGFATLGGADRTRALQLLRGIWVNAGTRPASAGEARTLFEAGAGDALLTYEADRFRAGLAEYETVYPSRTVMTESIVMKIDRNIPEEHRRVVDAFVGYLWSDEAQKTLVRYGFRSVREELNAGEGRFAGLKDSFTLKQIGGAAAASRDIMDDLWYREIYASEKIP